MGGRIARFDVSALEQLEAAPVDPVLAWARLKNLIALSRPVSRQWIIVAELSTTFEPRASRPWQHLMILGGDYTSQHLHFGTSMPSGGVHSNGFGRIGDGGIPDRECAGSCHFAVSASLSS